MGMRRTRKALHVSLLSALMSGGGSAIALFGGMALEATELTADRSARSTSTTVLAPALLNRAELIFVGTVEQIEPLPFECGIAISYQRVHYRVSQVMKGILTTDDRKPLVISYQCGVSGPVRLGASLLVPSQKKQDAGLPPFLANLQTLEATPETVQAVRMAMLRKRMP